MLAAFAFGRFSASYLMRYVDPPKLMSAYSIMNIGLLLDRSAGMARHLGRLPYEFLHVADVPTIFASGLCGLGPNTKLGARSRLWESWAVRCDAADGLDLKENPDRWHSICGSAGGVCFVALNAYVGATLRPRGAISRSV